jgi:hypothetical protein
MTGKEENTHGEEGAVHNETTSNARYRIKGPGVGAHGGADPVRGGTDRPGGSRGAASADLRHGAQRGRGDPIATPPNSGDGPGKLATTVSQDPTREAALQYVDHEFDVVLLHGVEGSACTCPRGAQCRSPGKHPLDKNWLNRAVRTREELRTRWTTRDGKPTNLGILLTTGSRLLLIDVDVKDGKKGPASLAEWERVLGIDFSNYLTQLTPSGGRHYLFRVPEGIDVETLPNRSAVAPGIDVFRDGRQFVVAPSAVAGGHRYRGPDGQIPVVLPPINEIPVAAPALLEHLQSLGGNPANGRGSVKDLESLRAPSVDHVRRAVSSIPNNENVDRNQYIWMAHRIFAACGPGNQGEAREIFLEWAGQYPGANADEDARVFDTLDWTNVRGGWDELWPLAAQHGYDASTELLRQAQEMFVAEPDGHRGQQGAAGPRLRGQQPSKGARLLNEILGHPDIEVFHSCRGKRPYVRVRHRGRWQTHSLNSTLGAGLLRHVMSKGGTYPSTHAFTEALQGLRSYARFESAAREVYLRVARLGATVYVDLGDDTFRAIEITPDGWSIVDDPPVYFVRNEGMLPLPGPIRGGWLADFAPFFPTSLDELRLLVSFMMDTFAAPERSARPILVIDGPPGSAKTTMTRFAKDLTDPQVGGLAAPPQNERDLVISARSSHVVALDNASTIPLWLSDALSRLSAGGGLRTRRLYTDEEETIFDERRPVILNSVGDIAKQNDLRDRALFITATRLSSRRPDEELQADFHAAKGRLFGVLLDAVVSVLKTEGSVTVPSSDLPRMAGFATRGAAAAEVFGWSPTAFLEAYRANIEQAAMVYLDTEVVARTLLSQSWRGARNWRVRRLRERGTSDRMIAQAIADWGTDVVWKGSSSDLLAYLEEQVGAEVTRKPGWPREVRRFGRELRMAAGSMRLAGWELEFSRSGSERIVIIRRTGGWDDDPPDLDAETSPNPRTLFPPAGEPPAAAPSEVGAR